MYIVDTDVSIEYMKGNFSAIELLESLDDLHLTTVTIAELFFGAYNSQRPAKNLPTLFNYVQRFSRLTMQLWDAIRFGKIKAELRRKGTIIGDADIMNASMALSYGFTVITRNVKDYERIKGLKILKLQ
ncbi:MAG TPA: type II toxin-antitoxin system VapC family toxin [Candidatus Nanoarchaeia archaeon]|nr:type II toxin-antitoxin system VapC family toxin [Candidatus Nanoarchaeia archaeon]